MPTCTLSFPAPPNLSQHTTHYWSRARKKKLYIKAATAELMAQWRNIPEPMRKTPWPFFTWRMHAQVYGTMDYDNLVTLAKWPLDTMKACGIIEDDGPKYCKPASFPTQEVLRSKVRQVFITFKWEVQ